MQPKYARSKEPVQDHAHRQLLQGDVVDDLIVRALHKRRIDRAEGLQALHGHAGREGDGVLLGDPHVIRPLGEALPKLIDAGAAGHGGGDRDDRAILRGDVDERLREDARVRRRLRRRRELAARRDLELWHAVILVAGGLRRGVALALVRLDVQEDRLGALAIADVLQDRHEVVEVVAVDRANVIKSELLKERAAGDHAARVLVNLGVRLLDLDREELVDRLRGVAERLERLRRD